MVGSIDIYKSLNISIEAVMRNQELLNFLFDHLKTEKMCKDTIKKLAYLSRYIPDRYETQQICNKVVLENGETLKFVPAKIKNCVIKLLLIALMH